eukprot:Blabericola_migrator_1__1742@NODE_146_length_12961_cov_103_787110_g127_i0_p9_GENE_NODE_146_length_12961_cov_103_787110_g127_i0NODE_146_length_12961_cov_103_787110_g127_i0_p9_ORF_typecomplete_len122_score15_71Folate_carrier/PF01770_18/0_16_NODE_146_length_12961_cov_103_787110_g127_i01203012395
MRDALRIHTRFPGWSLGAVSGIVGAVFLLFSGLPMYTSRRLPVEAFLIRYLNSFHPDITEGKIMFASRYSRVYILVPILGLFQVCMSEMKVIMERSSREPVPPEDEEALQSLTDLPSYAID